MKDTITSADIIGKDRLTLSMPFDVVQYVKDQAKKTGDTPSKIVEIILRQHYEEGHG